MGKRDRDGQSAADRHGSSHKKKRKVEKTTDESRDIHATAGLQQGNEHVAEASSIKAAVAGDEVGSEAKVKHKKKKKRDKHEDGAGRKDTPAVAAVQTAPPPFPLKKTKDAPYVQSQALTDMAESEIETFLSENFISIADPDSTSPRPILGFDHLPADCRDAAVLKTFKSPTPIQAATWPFLLSNRDVVGIAETGSGKTLAFGLPCVRRVRSLVGRSGGGGTAVVRAVIVSPTRELAMQIHEQMAKLVVGTGVRCVCVYGGMPKDEQRAELAASHIVIATPGRLNDFIQEGTADLSRVGYLVLDEADRMLDKGFEQEIRKIVGQTPVGKVQTAMFTATWPPDIRQLAESFMRRPVKIAIGDNPSGELRANARVTQKVEVIDPRDKEQRLLQLLKQYQSGKNQRDRILIFCLYKKEAARVEDRIRARGFRVAGIHGDMNQAARTKSLEGFRDGSIPLLVATDVAARGLDIPAVKVVINVTFPLTAEDYVHRIGRTGRAGQDGLAVTLFTEHDKALSGALVNVLRGAKQPVPEELMKFGTTVKKKAHDAYGAFFKDTAGEKKATKITFD